MRGSDKFRVFGRLVGAVCCVFAAHASTVRAGGVTGRWLVVDRDADPASFGSDSGAVFIYEDGVLVGWIASLQFVDPIRAHADSAGNIYILDASADPLNTGGPTGTMFLYDTNETISVFAADSATADLKDFVRAADGTLYAIGSSTSGGQPSSVVFRIDATGEVSTFASGTNLSDPVAIDIDGEGYLLICDQTAQVGALGEVGAIFRVSPAGDITVLATSLQFAEPNGIAVRPDGLSCRVLDRTADPQGIGLSGAVFTVAGSGNVSVWAVDSRFSELTDIYSTSDDGALVLDSAAIQGPPGASPGIVFDVSPAGSVVVALADESAWSSASGVCPAAPAKVSGDFDGDGDVDLGDFSNFALCFAGSNLPPAASCPPGVDADFDQDGDVDLGDFATFALNFTGSQ